MHQIIVIKVIGYVLEGQIAVVVVRVVASSDRLVQALVQVSQQLSTLLRPVHKHRDNEAEVQLSHGV